MAADKDIYKPKRKRNVGITMYCGVWNEFECKGVKIKCDNWL